MRKSVAIAVGLTFAIAAAGCDSGSSIQSRGEAVSDWYTSSGGQECRDYEDGSTWCNPVKAPAPAPAPRNAGTGGRVTLCSRVEWPRNNRRECAHSLLSPRARWW